MPSDVPVLSICIPTYNRAGYLTECLSSLAQQIESDVELRSLVEVIVSDNGSIDDTRSVVARFAPKFPRITTIRHKTNLGLDSNVNGCIRAASGEYIWVFSDDDVISYGTLRCVVAVIRAQPDIGMLHLSSYGFRGIHKPLTVNEGDFSVRTYTTSADFLKSVSYWITFLSGNIFRRDAEVPSFKMEDYDGSLFGFLAFYLGVLINRATHVRLEGPMFARREDNVVGGYKLFRTFTVNLNRLFGAGISRGLDASAVNVVNAEILTYFLPSFTLKLKATANQGARIELGPIRPLIESSWRYPEMWLITAPVRLIPLSIGPIYWRASTKACAVFRYLRKAA